MRVIRRVLLFLLLLLLAISIVLFLFNDKESTQKPVNHIYHESLTSEKELQNKQVPEKIISDHILQDNLFKWMGSGVNQLEEALGEPLRKDISSYGYTWLVYMKDHSEYVQFGVMDDEVKTIFATGMDVGTNSIKIGDDYDHLNQIFSFSTEVTYGKGITSYTFQLDEEDLKMRPLVRVGNDVYMQLYFDTFTQKLSSIRILTGEILLLQRPYALSYRGDLPEQPKLSDEQWDQVEAGMESQIFDITNVIRNSFDRSTLEWEESVKEVAYLHSKDMAENNYFSHYALNGDGLKERLAAQDIFYFSAGENIAALYVDAPAAVEGWLNSEGHREALLNNDFTHLGVGVFRYYYTQNFLTKP
ncbi:CAP domain-containing protein [Ornithinibacillus halophilus]|uniref:Uncharacterized conserved protein YkwD, contains CAP (CSP/antigen 5/PR1) domain n=1 Tax=Ornithinibacillus halophilus TaxID=930117 RepID=A0A1M5C2B4_9BACI|nr:CAP domain-containing protein [Ornithinibacillus halophilus]SHF48889.1 Uncharacterized conserved protein YkwD, contains CAP (CSP/antigen 5/PR1) domain [Ornithinibacillus halophilus]